VAEIVLDGSRIVAVIGKLVAAGVPQHVDVNREAELGPFANVLDLPIEGVRREWCAALAGEHKLGVRPLVGAELAERPQFIAADRMQLQQTTPWVFSPCPGVFFARKKANLVGLTVVWRVAL